MTVDLQNALVAMRLLRSAERAERKHKHPLEHTPTLKEDMETDQVILEGAKPGVKTQNVAAQAPPTVKIEQEQIKLADLIEKLKELEDKSAARAQPVQSTRIVSETRTLEWEISLTQLEKVDGLVVRGRTLAETDRYRFDFTNGTELTITDKWSSKSTRIWGDPHIDTNDEEGENNGDFKDLTGSDSQTSFMLTDGTRLTITAKDDGIIEAVDIIKGSQHVQGTGAGSQSWSEETGLFDTALKTDGLGAGASLTSGDTVFVGGDGNDWYDRSGNLIWGATSGPVVTQRPSSVMAFKASYTMERQVIQIDKMG